MRINEVTIIKSLNPIITTTLGAIYSAAFIFSVNDFMVEPHSTNPHFFGPKTISLDFKGKIY